MRNIIIVLTIIALVGCMVPTNDLDLDVPDFDNVKETTVWVHQNIKYKKDKGNDWKLPQETLEDGSGDCEDMALLILGIMYCQKGEKGRLIVVKGKEANHVLALYNDKYWDGTNGKSYGDSNCKVLYNYDYDYAMYLAEFERN